jgi:hypothetical protein
MGDARPLSWIGDADAWATIAARDPTPSFAKIRRRCVETVHELILNTSAMILLE